MKIVNKFRINEREVQMYIHISYEFGSYSRDQRERVC